MTFKRMITAVDSHSGIPMRVITRGVGHTGTVGMHESHALHEDVYNAFMAADPARAEAAIHKLIETAILDAREGLATITAQTKS
jgi:DNA-binding GntR family transcriptional regulator